MPAIWAGIIAGIGGGLISAGGASKAQKSAAANQQKMFANANNHLDRLAAGEFGSLEEMFGSPLDPEAFLYHPVDITQSQMDTISGNIQAFPSALQLTNMVNPSIWRNDLERIRTMMPTFDDSRDIYLGATKRLLAGQLPFQDVEDIVSNRSGISGMLGTPGGGRNATLRDLGLSRLNAIQTGGSMFQQFVNMAEQISPVGAQMRPQQMMFSPQERLQADILQRSLEQQGRASAAMAEAMPDPAQNAIANARIGVNMAGMGAGFQPTQGAGMQALGQSISGMAGMFGMLGRTGQQAPQSLYGGGMSIGASPFGGSPAPQSYYNPAAFTQGGFQSAPSYVTPTWNSYPVGSGGSSGNISAALFPGQSGGGSWWGSMAQGMAPYWNFAQSAYAGAQPKYPSMSQFYTGTF